jgi:hypothetical protein
MLAGRYRFDASDFCTAYREQVEFVVKIIVFDVTSDTSGEACQRKKYAVGCLWNLQFHLHKVADLANQPS